MKTTRKLVVAATVAGASLLPAIGFAAPAGADPTVTAWSGDELLGPIAVENDDLTIAAEGCVDPEGGTTYMGETVDLRSTPTGPVEQSFRFEDVAVDGGGNWPIAVDVGGATSAVYATAHWYCATEPNADLSDPESVLWVSSAWEMTIMPGTPNRPLTATERIASNSAGDAVGTVSLDVDPDGLPVADRMGIVGAPAARLKATVDANVDTVARVSRLYAAYLGRTPEAGGLQYWVDQLDRGVAPGTIAAKFATTPEFRNGRAQLSDGAFVDAVYQSVLGRSADASGRAFWLQRLRAGVTGKVAMVRAFAESAENVARTADTAYVMTAHLVTGRTLPSAAAIEASVDRLRSGEVKVAVVEDIALTYRSADHWNRTA